MTEIRTSHGSSVTKTQISVVPDEPTAGHAKAPESVTAIDQKARAVPRRLKTIGYVVLLGLIASLPAVTTDLYLPSLPSVARDLQASTASVQLTMSAALIGGAIGQLINGPLTDRFGRRRPLLVGVGLHIALSLACAWAPSVGVLVVLRAFQGICNAAATVVAMAVIRDTFRGVAAARLRSHLMLVVAVAPLFAPSVGGFIAHRWSWHATFIALALFGALLFAVASGFLKESLPVDKRLAGGVVTVASGYVVLIRDRKFMGYALLPAVGVTTIFCYIVGSPSVFQEQYTFSTQQFSALFAANGVALILSSQLNAVLVSRISASRLLAVGVFGQATAVVVLLIAALVGMTPLGLVLPLLWLTLAFQGFIGPNAQTLALAPYGYMAGTASAVVGAFMTGVAGALSPLVGVLGGDLRAMATVMASVLLVGVAIVIRGKGNEVSQRGKQTSEMPVG